MRVAPRRRLPIFYAAVAIAAALNVSPAVARGDLNDEGATELRARLLETYPATRFGEVRPTVVEGLFEVELGRNIAYVEPEGRYFFFGHVYDMREQTDLTAERKAQMVSPGIEIDQELLAGLDTFVVQSGSPVLTVFSDPFCGYCKALEKTLAANPQWGLRIALLAYQPGSDGLAHRIRCADDPARAWRAWMLEDIKPSHASKPSCTAQGLQENARIARRIGVNGTPTIVTESGRMQAGALEAQALKVWLEQSPVARIEKENSR